MGLDLQILLADVPGSPLVNVELAGDLADGDMRISLDPGVHSMDGVLRSLGSLPTTPRDSVKPSSLTKFPDLPINC